ncbi:hypothetical protein Ancab_000161 [Ancistrocladus abbreviatus]
MNALSLSLSKATTTITHSLSYALSLRLQAFTTGLVPESLQTPPMSEESEEVNNPSVSAIQIIASIFRRSVYIGIDMPCHRSISHQLTIFFSSRPLITFFNSKPFSLFPFPLFLP